MPKHIDKIGVTEISPVISYLQKHGIGAKEIDHAWKSAGGLDALVRFTRRRLRYFEDGSKPTKTKRVIPVPSQQVLRKSTDLVNKIREFCRSQKDLWRQVPYLALEADGRTGYSDCYKKAYMVGYWEIQCSIDRGVYNVYVDLETGELVSPFDYQKKAPDEYVLQLAPYPKEMDATHVIEGLKKDAERPTWSGYDLREQARWRARLRKELGLGKIYARKHPIKVDPHRGWIEDMVSGWGDDPTHPPLSFSKPVMGPTHRL